MTTADRSDTHAPDETARLKTPGPCTRVIYFDEHNVQVPQALAVIEEQCGGRFWRGPIINTEWERYGEFRYAAICRKCGNKVKM